MKEIPGGKCDETDETILHGVARELKEETGLNVKRFIRKAGQLDWEDGLPHHRKTERWVKLVFEVEVEVYDPVMLDPLEHQQYCWATEEEVEKEKTDNTTLKYISPPNKTIKLDAFRLRRAQKVEKPMARSMVDVGTEPN